MMKTFEDNTKGKKEFSWEPVGSPIATIVVAFSAVLGRRVLITCGVITDGTGNVAASTTTSRSYNTGFSSVKTTPPFIIFVEVERPMDNC
jgi:hypothetical protein